MFYLCIVSETSVSTEANEISLLQDGMRTVNIFRLIWAGGGYSSFILFFSLMPCFLRKYTAHSNAFVLIIKTTKHLTFNVYDKNN